MKCKFRGFTLAEMTTVMVIVAILAAATIPQFMDSTGGAQQSAARFNIQSLRGQLEAYKARHLGQYPPTLADLTANTNVDHTTAGSPALGPCCLEIPSDAVTGSSAVVETSRDPIGAVTGTTGGWLYNAATGEIRINHEDFDRY